MSTGPPTGNEEQGSAGQLNGNLEQTRHRLGPLTQELESAAGPELESTTAQQGQETAAAQHGQETAAAQQGQETAAAQQGQETAAAQQGQETAAAQQEPMSTRLPTGNKEQGVGQTANRESGTDEMSAGTPDSGTGICHGAGTGIRHRAGTGTCCSSAGTLNKPSARSMFVSSYCHIGSQEHRRRTQMQRRRRRQDDLAVKCLLCAKELGYNNNTSSMLRHFCALHTDAQANRGAPTQVTRKQELDEALVSMIPFSIVEDQGFSCKIRSNLCNPNKEGVKAVKAMVKGKYEEEKQKAMWTSINMDAYLALTCHYIDASTTLRSTVLGVVYFPDKHAAVNLATVKTSLVAEWGIGAKVTCLVTDGAANMLACGMTPWLRHAIRVAHTLNLIVKKCLDLTPVLSTIRTKARRLVGYFRSSTREACTDSGANGEAYTKANPGETTVDQREPVGAALSGLDSDILVLTSEEYANITGNCGAFRVEKSVWLQGDSSTQNDTTTLQEKTTRSTNPLARELGEHLIKHLREKLHTLQSSSIMSRPTLLDPRFKTIGVFSPTKADEAVRRLSSECANIIRETSHHPSSPSTSSHNVDERPGTTLGVIEASVMASRMTHNVTADATVEVQRYLSEPNIRRTDDPLLYWERHKCIYPNLYKLPLVYLCTPVSSVPCDRVLSKAGEVISKKRNRLNPNTVQQILFLNKNP
ncbi:Zinc finger BED domain-containing protein 1 [Merluccius polli]|uniref:Zinc finger BED domain-containing protein 1 n=1 Tax=Merluccius polli TaxID=89951 RepID=A0AA47NRI2_MERPO|nr:Zinc finger BED domain-containing protein 1 [Merluccius polli]